MATASSSADINTELARERTGLANDRTRWAADRTLWAADRTLIAWVRTALSLIGFGFGIGKVVDYVEKVDKQADPIRTAKILGASLIVLAVLALFGAIVQHVRINKRLADRGYARVEPIPLGLAVAVLLLLIGIFAFVALML